MPADYLNVEAIRPKYDTPVDPITAGMWSQRDRTRYDNAASLQDMMHQIEGQKALEDLYQGAPVRTAERASKLATLPLEGPRKQAELDELQLKNNQTRGTQDSTIAATNAINRGKIGDANQNEVHRSLTLAAAKAKKGMLELMTKY